MKTCNCPEENFPPGQLLINIGFLVVRRTVTKDAGIA